MISYNVEMIMALVIFTTAFAFSFLFVPLSKKIAFKFNAVAYPRDRDMHNKPMPRMGGTAIVFGSLVAIIVYSGVMKDIGNMKLAAIIVSSLIVVATGFIDDIYVLSAKHKILGQLISAVIVVAAGVKIDSISWPFNPDKLIHFGPLSYIITIVFILGITNAVNFIDGLDGLAAGVSSIGALYIMFISIFLGSNSIVLFTAALAGACVGFLPYNFNPAQIFMGDVGSTFLGYMLAISSVLGLFKGYATVVVLVIILGIPIFDTGFAIIRRMASGKSFLEALSTADRGHLHHRLVDKGLSQRRAVLILYGIALLLGTTGVFVLLNSLYLASITFFIVAISLFFILKKEKDA